MVPDMCKWFTLQELDAHCRVCRVCRREGNFLFSRHPLLTITLTLHSKYHVTIPDKTDKTFIISSLS